MSTQPVSEELTTPNDYRKELRIDAPSDKVYEALTTHDGIAGWWTGNVQGDHQEGGIVRVEFEGPGHRIDMRVEELRNPELVSWTCVSHNVFTEWPTTQVNFALNAESEASCKLNFEHIGLKPSLVCYEHCRLGWDHFLASLASFSETGVGSPWSS